MIINNARNGIISSSDVSKMGIHRSVLTKMVNEGELVKVDRGLYMLPDEWEDEFCFAQRKYQKGIFSHSTALYLLGYSERVPLKLCMTFPTKYNCVSLEMNNISYVRVNDANYKLGIIEVMTPIGNIVKTYDVERCICDMLRGHGNDFQITQFALKKYVNSKERNINKLMSYAKQLHVESKLKKYMEVLM